MKSLDEWMKIYETKTGNKIKNKEDFKVKALYDAEKGFLLLEEKGDCILLSKCCGDGQYWYDVAIEIAEKKQKSYLKAFSLRNIKSVFKAYGFHRFRGVKRKNDRVIYGYDKKAREIVAKQVGISPHNIPAYEITLKL